MAKGYKGFKGSGMNRKMTKGQMNALVREYFVKLVATKEGQEFMRKRREERKVKSNEPIY